MSKVVVVTRRIFAVLLATGYFCFDTEISAEPYQIYFNQPPLSTHSLTNPQKGIDEALIDFINGAQSGDTLYVAIYNLSRPNIKTAILNTVNRLGEQNVFLIFEKSNTSNLNNILGPGKVAQYRDDGTTDSNKLMHNKFVVIKDSAIWTGSYNFTYDSTFNDNNNAIIIWSKEVAQCYEQEFLNMYSNNLFGLAKSTSTTKPAWNGKIISLEDGTQIKIYFSPYTYPKPVNQAISEELDSARENVYFNIFTFGTNSRLDDKLINCRDRNIDVAGVLETEQVYSSYYKMKDAGLAVVLDNNSGLLHHKFTVIDFNRTNANVLTGSNNWTNTANESNDENMLVIDSPKIANIYYQEFRTNYQLAGGRLRIQQNEIIKNVTVYPSPVKEKTNIKFKISEEVSSVQVNIYNLVGEKVKDITLPTIYSGYYNEAVWYLDNASGEKVASGIYLVKIIATTNQGTFVATQKLSVLK